MIDASGSTGGSSGESVLKFVLLLFSLSLPLWVLGAVYDVQVFPGLKLYQLPLAMPMVAALILTYRENGTFGLLALLKRVYDIRNVNSVLWYLPILLAYPSIGLINYWLVRLSGASIPAPQFSWQMLAGYGSVFLMTYGEELGLTGYAIDRLQTRHSALMTGLLLGVLWAGYHLPGFVISGYYSLAWIFWHVLYTIVSRVLFVWVYNNAGQSLFSMALFHWTFGLFWILWPETGNLQKAVFFYDPRICALVAMAYVGLVTLLWGPRTLTRFRYWRSDRAPPRTLGRS